MSAWSTLDTSRWDEAAWARLERAARGGRDPMRTPVLATVDEASHPRARTVVLRAASQEGRGLEAYADLRSPKIGELRARPEASWVFYDPEDRLQVRARAHMEVLSGEAAALRFAALSEHARRDYATAAAPGATLEASEVHLHLERAEQNFAVLRARVHTMDILVLDNAGHRRLRLEYAAGGLVVTKLVP